MRDTEIYPMLLGYMGLKQAIVVGRLIWKSFLIREEKSI